MPFRGDMGIGEYIAQAAKWHNEAETWKCLAKEVKDERFKRDYQMIGSVYESMSQRAISMTVENCQP